MKKIYNPYTIEQSLYNYWEKQGYFKPNNDKKKDSFCIMIPPPNITGSLHIGHAFQQTIMDTIIRYQRMLGKDTLYQVGTDHAGIATQILVEHKIFSENGKTRKDYGRESFVNKIWKWKKEFGSIIVNQMRYLGNSVDWDRERFTMDEKFSYSVKEIFIRLYKENLIYRSKRLVNWDTKLQTAVSDLEVEKRELKSFMWYIRYPIADNVKTIDGKDYLVIATTRPETLLGDTGVAVNPEDPYYKNLINKFVILPLVNRRIPIIGDKYANIDKGTGCVKITPAHNFDDYEVGFRHQLPMINILNFDGCIRDSAEVFDFKGNNSNIYSNKIPKEFQKLDLFTARKEIISSLRTLNLIEKIKPYNIGLLYSDRSGTVIEPMLTDQWYLKVKKLAKPAIEAVKKGDIQFIPKQYENIYFSWMHNIKDWCISRQLWWGHRIPAWYDKKGNIYVGHNEENVRQENNLSYDTVLYQEDDVLDTWFSSSLWTFSVLGWPNDTYELHRFHPVNIVVSGFDIIFFWIARMIMMTMHFIKNKNGIPQVPFKIVYITGLILDDKGYKMSKSNGNIIDPLDIINGISLEKLLKKRTSNMMRPKLKDKIYKHTQKEFPNGIKSYGTDALRFTLISLANNSRSISFNMQYLENSRHFCNKLWNASRFVIINTENQDCGFVDSMKILSLADRWILSEFNKTVRLYREKIDSFRFDIAAKILYKFTWNQFCDWYIELTKPIISYGSEIEQRGTRNTLIVVLESLLRLIHPIMPFITETIWQYVKNIMRINNNTIMLSSFPDYNLALVDKTAFLDIEWIKSVIIIIRNTRIQMNIKENKPIDLILRNCSHLIICRVNNNLKFIKIIASLKTIKILPVYDSGPPSIIRIVEGAELLFPISSVEDKNKEINRLIEEIKKLETKIDFIKNKLENESFRKNAPESILNKEHKKLTEYIELKLKLIKQKMLISEY